MDEQYRAPAGSFFGPRSHCHWIESAGIEDTPPFAPLQGDQTADVVIGGGGYTGLSAGLHLAESFPERRIVVLEGARVGYGASGRNCGLVLPFITGAERVVHDLVDEGRIDEARKIFEATSAGIGLIEELVKKRGVDCEWEPVESLYGALTPRHQAKLEREQRTYAALGLEATWLPENELRQRIDVPGYRGALTVPCSTMINPAKLATGLLALARAAGVEVHEESPVVDITAGKTVHVRTPRGSVRAPVLVLATNAYTHHLRQNLGFLRGRVLPVHCFSIASAPLTKTQIAALSWGGRQPFLDVRSFFDLFRLTADNRILLSGGDGFFYYGAGIDVQLIPFCANGAYYTVLALVMVAVLQLFGIETTSLVAMIGAAGLTIGLALQGTLSSFAAGVMLLIFRPFKVGDYVEVSGSSGTVSEIDLFTTTLNTSQNLQVLIPNASVYGKTITNYSANETRRVDVNVGIGYEDDIGSAMQIIEEITTGDPRVLSEPATAILVSELADSSVNLTVRAWCERTDYGALRSDLLRTLKEKLEAGGCSIPFPQQDVHIVSNTAPK